ncbi:MAG TPA: helix-turn-helix transcriptional regulator [Solirubrobacterales bacterium]
MIVPDGCLDLVFFAGRELVVAGADTRAREVEIPARTQTVGIRLRPGAAGAVLGVPATELVDSQASASEVWGREALRWEEALAAAAPERRRGILSASVAARGASPDRLVAAAASRLSDGQARVADVAADLGISERQLQRRTRAAVGYGPKTLARVARLSRLRAAAGPLARRALDAGYASQAHMNDEVRRLTGLTPVGFLEDPTGAQA